MTGATQPRRRRKDPRKEATRAAIIERAEVLFALNGIEGVSLRQIGSATGSANTSVVAYHFGSKEALVEAIFHYRLPEFEARRRALLAQVRQSGRQDSVFSLMRALWWPLFEQVNAEGQHSYAGFMTALMHSSYGVIRATLNPDYPVATELGECLRNALPVDVRSRFESRLLAVTLMVTGALQMMGRLNPPGDRAALFEDTLRMASAALSAPVGE